MYMLFMDTSNDKTLKDYAKKLKGKLIVLKSHCHPSSYVLLISQRKEGRREGGEEGKKERRKKKGLKTELWMDFLRLPMGRLSPFTGK